MLCKSAAEHFPWAAKLAGTTGLEPAASAVTGQRSNQLNYVPTLKTQTSSKAAMDKASAGFA